MAGDGTPHLRCASCKGPPKAFRPVKLPPTHAPCPDCGHSLAQHGSHGCRTVAGTCVHGSPLRRVRRRVRCTCPRTLRVGTSELDAWLLPVWQRATSFFGVAGWARYEWYNGTCYGRCHLWDPSKVSLSRPHFRRFMLEDDQREAAAVVLHELLHGLGLQHDKRIGWSVGAGFRTDYELVDRVFDGKALTENVRKVLRRVSKAAKRRYRLFCAGTTREHRVGADGFTCRHCGVPVGEAPVAQPHAASARVTTRS